MEEVAHCHAVATLPTGTLCIGGWKGPGPVWISVENFAPLGFHPRPAQPIASRPVPVVDEIFLM
jgi:hypothetical protein